MPKMKTKYYSPDGGFLESPIDPYPIFQRLWIKKCEDKAAYSLPLMAFKLGMLSSLGAEMFHYRQVEYLNKQGDFNLKLTPNEERKNNQLRSLELEYFGESMSFEDINQAVEDWLDENYPIQVQVQVQ